MSWSIQLQLLLLKYSLHNKTNKSVGASSIHLDDYGHLLSLTTVTNIIMLPYLRADHKKLTS